MKTIRIGLVGTGFSAALHAEAYRLVHGYDACICAAASPAPDAKAFAKKYGIPSVYGSMKEMLAAQEIDLVDICTPPCMHVSMIREALAAKKHVISEKPLTGWFGNPQDPRMLEHVTEELDSLREAVNASGKHFFYAENFVYAPSVQKSRGLIKAAGDKVLFLRGEESHSGSHAPHAALWSANGGGSLIRQGCHPLSALLYLKGAQAGNCGVVDVMGDMGYLVPALTEQERRHISARPKDVEDLANVTFTFSDGTKGSVTAGDMVLGGVRNTVEVFTTGGAHRCNIAPNDAMQVYHVEDEKLQNEYFTEKLETRRGWQSVFLDESYARGYVGELQDFLMCAAGDKANPESGFALAYETTRVIYAAYQSALLGKRISL
ncbi:gfo/Idh/MocA family oxidoreductase [Anaerotruncus sp. AF02-27]|jgi:predicted dehydrogenase|uniref:Gfo/Idh/MocA family protein n=1 Tax=Anaerotruncus TaxID=244127 RepID=UPI000E4DCABB|nr:MULTISPECIES: Gfo/Idh/MocA family oxidoreductase [Anaerotruncus]RGX54985.1 gfo/Idh/MocA family oxidoreductase [Anaerotruncus sp. AF02-27]